jgi:hypothetical protein
VTFPPSEEEEDLPEDLDYRIQRIVYYSGLVKWKIQRYICTEYNMKLLYYRHYPNREPKYTYTPSTPGLQGWKLGSIVPQWLDIPGLYNSEEEAIEYLNENLRSCDIMEESTIYSD